jgi:hypothetical protein
VSERKTDFRTPDRWLNFALVLGPAAWIAHLNYSYMLVPESCAGGSKLKLHIATAICVAVALLAAAIAWAIRGRIAEEPELWHERARWMATFIVVLSVSMAVVIVAQEIPNLMLRSCQ